MSTRESHSKFCFSEEVDAIIKDLKLERHPIENGYWRLMFDSTHHNYSSFHQGKRKTFGCEFISVILM